ncbi:MAG: 4a-hydroxytetrahydrobiopterin dehydratase [Nitrospiria bacterium]
MTDLNKKTCVACRVGAPLATEEEIRSFLPQIPEWKIIQIDAVNHLTRKFKFKNFLDALALTNKIGTLAETENHHPALLTEWGSLEVSWWTHKIHGLHVNDFIMAAKTDLLYEK